MILAHLTCSHSQVDLKQGLNIGLSDDKFKITISDTSASVLVSWLPEIGPRQLRRCSLPHIDDGTVLVFIESTADSSAELELGLIKLFASLLLAKKGGGSSLSSMFVLCYPFTK